MSAIIPPPRAVLGLALLTCTGLAGCDRTDEAAMRAHVVQWFALGPTMAFTAQQDCAAGVFRLVDTQVGSGMPIAGSLPRAWQVLESRGVVAADVAEASPDEMITRWADDVPVVGLKLRAIALEARLCMDELTISAFGYALTNPKAVLAYDAKAELLMVMDRDTRVLIVAMGAG